MKLQQVCPKQKISFKFYPHLVLLDINLKGEDGRRWCWELKKLEPQVKVIIMSGYDYNVGRALLFGADDLLPKPINFDYLLHQINQLLSDVVGKVSR